MTHAYFGFTLVYLGHMAHHATGGIVPYKDAARVFLRYLANTLFCIFANLWCFGPLVFERVDVAAGGHCIRITEPDQTARGLSRHQCTVGSNTRWVAGFDISGHFYLLASISLLVLDQVEEVRNDRLRGRDRIDQEAAFTQLDTEPLLGEMDRVFFHNVPVLAINKTVFNLSLVLVGTWYFEFVITSLFFHTFFEKLCGLVAAMVVPILLSVWDGPATAD